MNDPHARIRARRTVVARGSLVALVFVSASACVFDQSDYQGGGRLDQGGTVKQVTSGSSSSTAPTASGSASDASADAAFDATLIYDAATD